MQADYFKPRAVPLRKLEEVVLTLDEFEAMRLADLEEKYQEDAARGMNISRQTFGNIIQSAHRKIAEALVMGKAIRIEGGAVRMDGAEERRFVCAACGHARPVAFGTDRPKDCPSCGGADFRRCASPERGNSGGRRSGPRHRSGCG